MPIGAHHRPHGERCGQSQEYCHRTSLAGLPRVTLEDPALAAKALDWMAGGMDFADALHLAKADGCDAFISFDQRFAVAANALSAVKVRVP